jgi:hypothetical protein
VIKPAEQLDGLGLKAPYRRKGALGVSVRHSYPSPHMHAVSS